MQTTIKILKYELWASVALTLLICALFETGVLLEGPLCGNSAAHLLSQMWMTVIVLFSIPIALKMFTLRYVRERLTADESRSAQRLLRWGTVRLLLLAVPMMAGMLCYYLFGADVRFFYLALIEALALFFIYPSKARCEREVK